MDYESKDQAPIVSMLRDALKVAEACPDGWVRGFLAMETADGNFGAVTRDEWGLDDAIEAAMVAMGKEPEGAPAIESKSIAERIDEIKAESDAKHEAAVRELEDIRRNRLALRDTEYQSITSGQISALMRAVTALSYTDGSDRARRLVDEANDVIRWLTERRGAASATEHQSKAPEPPDPALAIDAIRRVEESRATACKSIARVAPEALATWREVKREIGNLMELTDEEAQHLDDVDAALHATECRSITPAQARMALAWREACLCGRYDDEPEDERAFAEELRSLDCGSVDGKGHGG